MVTGQNYCRRETDSCNSGGPVIIHHTRHDCISPFWQTMVNAKYGNFFLSISKSRPSCQGAFGSLSRAQATFICSVNGMLLRTSLDATCLSTSSSPFRSNRDSHSRQSSGDCKSSGSVPDSQKV